MARGTTFRHLAVEAGVDLDEALVAAWDAGLDFLEDVGDSIPPSAVGSVRKVLGLANPKQMQHLSFWETEWGIDREGVVRRLEEEFGVHVSQNARTLPKGALRRLRASGQGALLQVERPLGSGTSTVTGAADPFDWNPPGHCREVEPLTSEEICQIHLALVRDFIASGDPIDPPGVRDDNLLRSAAGRPETALGEVRKYTTLEVHAAALLHSLVHNHPFHNGNKRTALVSMLVLLDRNNVLLTCSQQELFKLVLRVAQHRIVPAGSTQIADREVVSIAEWICRHGRPIQRGERPLKWKDLRKVLSQLDCTVSSPMPGNKVKIERMVSDKVLGITRHRRLRVTAGYRNDGMEVDVSSLNYIRRDLRLDERYGFDSEYFYGKSQQRPDEFIAQYRTLLRRLGRL